MRQWAAALLVGAVLLVGVWPAEAGRGGHGHRGGFHHGGHHRGGHHHHHKFRSSVFIGVGPVWWGPRFYPYYAYPYPYYWPYYYPYYSYPAPVVVREPAVYIQQSAPAEPSPAPEPSAYWYYCQSAKAYYPSAPSCPEAWIKVAPRNP